MDTKHEKQDLSTAPMVRADASSPYEPRSYDEARLVAKDFAGSKLTKARTVEQTLMIMATGHELGIPATAALRMIYVADFGQGDQITLSADLMVALCLSSPLCEYFECEESTEERAIYVAKRRGRQEKRRQFTMQDAQRAKLGAVGAGKDPSLTNWAKYPSVMLRHRAASLLAREVFPDVIGGFYTVDEAREIAEANVIEGRLVSSEVRPLSSTPPEKAAVVAAEQADAEPIEARAARWEAQLLAARSESDGRAVTKNIVAALPDREHPTRRALAALFVERKRAEWAAAAAADPSTAEPPHDPRTGEVLVQEEPGSLG